MVRFSRDKRFLIPVWFSEFLETSTALAALVHRSHPNLEVEVLTCEDETTYNYSTVTFLADEVEEALKSRNRYTLEELSEEVWYRAFSVQVAIRDPSVHEPFVIYLSVDRHAEPRRLMFYYQCVNEALETELLRYKRPSLVYGIGDGYSRPSAFNFVFGQRVIGTPLR